MPGTHIHSETSSREYSCAVPAPSGAAAKSHPASTPAATEGRDSYNGGVVHFPERIRMSREAYANPESRFHLTISAHPEVGKFAPKVRDAIWDSVLEQPSRGEICLYAACLMPDHLHLLVSSGSTDILRFLNSWKSWTTRVAWSKGHRGPLWQPGMWDRTIRTSEDFGNVMRYILDNPVRADLVVSFEDWQWNYQAPD